MRSISAMPRGCGSLKKGGFYAQGESGVGGSLGAWTWLLGEMVLGGLNYTFEVPARGMRVIDLSATLLERRLTVDPVDPERIRLVCPSLEHVPRFALIDHIGSQYYTPYSFARECRDRGPSRRIPAQIAEQIAGHTPIPIVFTHTWMPLAADPAWRTRLLEWAGVATDGWDLRPTPLQPGWGLKASDAKGETHWARPVLFAMHERARGKEAHLTTIMDPELVEQTLTVEQTVGVSWVTKCVYIAADGDDPDKLNGIAAKGIEPVELVDDWFGESVEDADE